MAITNTNSTGLPGTVARFSQAEAAGAKLSPSQLARLRQISKLMDNHFQIPGTGIRFGLDSIIGLVPGIGDVITSAIPLWIIYQAQKAGVSRWTLTRMAGNVAIDTVVGLVPVLGDAFDLVWKANAKNMKLLEKELLRQDRSSA